MGGGLLYYLKHVVVLLRCTYMMAARRETTLTLPIRPRPGHAAVADSGSMKLA